jgi:hypothetical protein
MGATLISPTFLASFPGPQCSIVRRDADLPTWSFGLYWIRAVDRTSARSLGLARCEQVAVVGMDLHVSSLSW